MPELPEVEVTRRSFADAIAGAQINKVLLGKPLRWPLQCEPEFLMGQSVLQVRRRGKYMLIDLSDGLLLLHLGMSGSIQFGSALPPTGVHDHFELHTNHGTLRLNDPRRFGAVVFAASRSMGGVGWAGISGRSLQALRRYVPGNRRPVGLVLPRPTQALVQAMQRPQRRHRRKHREFQAWRVCGG